MFENKQLKFERLVRAYSTELYRYAYWLCRDRFQAEDIVQEAFTRAWKNLGSLRDVSAAKSWLYTIVRREHAREYERKRLDIDAGQDLDALADTGGPSVLDAMEMREALESLPENYREPLLLQVLGGFSCEEIAEMIDTSTGAVMTRLSRARLALRKLPGFGPGRKVKTR